MPVLVGESLIGAGLLGSTLEDILATYTVQFAKAATLAAGVVDVVALDSPDNRIYEGGTIIVSNRHATGTITFTADGDTVPTNLGDDMFYVGPGEHFAIPRAAYGDVSLQLISPAACPYWVRVV